MGLCNRKFLFDQQGSFCEIIVLNSLDCPFFKQKRDDSKLISILKNIILRRLEYSERFIVKPERY